MRAPLKAGDNAPDFELEDFNGISVRLADFEGNSNVLLILVRGLN
jgi:peroxiredoxin